MTYSLEEIEREIYDIYRFFAIAAPGVQVQEQGHLAQLWALADRMYEELPE